MFYNGLIDVPELSRHLKTIGHVFDVDRLERGKRIYIQNVIGNFSSILFLTYTEMNDLHCFYLNGIQNDTRQGEYMIIKEQKETPYVMKIGHLEIYIK